MKTKLIILVVGLLMLVGVVGYGVLSMSNLNPAVVTDTDAISATTTDRITGRDSINTILAMNKNLDCSFVVGEGNDRHKGSGFFTKGMVRIDTLLPSTSNTPDASYLIMDKANDTMYSWAQVNGEKQGIKMSIKQIADIGSTFRTKLNEQTPNQVSPDTAVSYDCKPWIVDASVFVPPSDVEFMDIGNLTSMKPGMIKEVVVSENTLVVTANIDFAVPKTGIPSVTGPIKIGSINWGDSSPIETVFELITKPVISVTRRHTYGSKGLYTITATGLDGKTNTKTVSVNVATSIYTLADVKAVTKKVVDVIYKEVDGDYTLYHIELKNGKIYEVKVGYVPESYRDEQFRRTGYTGDIEALIAMAIL